MLGGFKCAHESFVIPYVSSKRLLSRKIHLIPAKRSCFTLHWSFKMFTLSDIQAQVFYVCSFWWNILDIMSSFNTLCNSPKNQPDIFTLEETDFEKVFSYKCSGVWIICFINLWPCPFCDLWFHVFPFFLHTVQCCFMLQTKVKDVHVTAVNKDKNVNLVQELVHKQHVFDKLNKIKRQF